MDTLTIVVISTGLVVVAILLWLFNKLENNINYLRSRLDTVLEEHITLVKSLGIAEGNVQGIALQEAKQEKIDKGIERETGSKEITGVIRGVVRPSK